jgi:hypothetical protein
MDEPKRRGRPPKVSFTPMPETKAEPVKRRRKNIIGANMPFIPKKTMEQTTSMLGFRPKKKPSRPVVQPNRI